MVSLRELCERYDIMLVQQHCLLAHKLSLLNRLHNDFYATDLSVVDTTSNLLVGQPYGGTAILYHKFLLSSVSNYDTSL